LITVVVVGGCGRIGFGPPGSDAAGANLPVLDGSATADASNCTPGPWQADFDSQLPSWVILWTCAYDGVVCTAGSGAASTALTGGQFVVTTSSDRSFAGLRSDPMSFRDMSVTVDVIATTSITSDADTTLSIDQTGPAGLRFHENSGLLVFSFNNGTSSDDTTVPYDPAVHRVWRIRESSGTSYFETSQDGSEGSFTIHRMLPSPALLDAVNVALAAGTLTADSNSGAAVFDNLRSCQEP
jgi:hypothetical protein